MSPNALRIGLIAAALSSGSLVSTANAQVQTRSVIINGVRLPDQQVLALESQYRTRVPDGDFWYDRATGAWGNRGGPTLGLILPGLRVGGPLRTDASNGHTGVFINGRQLHQLDVLGLTQITQVYPGRYWMDAQGNVGVEGGPALINLYALARARGQPGGAYSSYTRDGSMVGSDGNGCLVFNDPSSHTSATSSGC